MKLRGLSCLIVLGLLCALFCLPASGAEPGPGVHPDRVVPALKTFFIGTEGNYGSVNANDNGALSVGILQWHGARALKLLRRILSEYPASASCLSAALRAEILDQNTNWSSRTLNGTEKAAVSALLASGSGKSVQDAVAWEDLYAYVEEAWAAGMRCDAVVFYYASILNQFGSGGAKTYLRHIRTTLGVGSDYLFRDLDELHAAVHNTQSYGQRYLALRDKAYAFVSGLGWPLAEPEAPAHDFLDLPPKSSWARPGIDFVLARGLFAGVSDTAFAPKRNMTRAMLVGVLYRLADRPPVAGAPAFSDVDPRAWYAPAVRWAVDTGVTAGVSPGRFAPRKAVTRAQLAGMLYRYGVWEGRIAANGSDPEAARACLAGFSDAAAVPDWAAEALAWAVKEGIVSGFPCEGGFRLAPNDPATRAQVAAMLMRFVRGPKT